MCTLESKELSSDLPRIFIYSQFNIVLTLGVKIMKKLMILILLIVSVSIACKEDEEPILICGTIDPVADLPWLTTLTKELNDSYFGVYISIAKTTYEGNDVFVLRNCCPNCNSVIPVYSCSGDQIGILSANTGINPSILDNAEVIWKGDLYVCTN